LNSKNSSFFSANCLSGSAHWLFFRVSELLALRWCDVDFENLELRVTRSIWYQVVGNCKTEASAKPVPVDSYMAEDLLRWRRQSAYASDDDYVFASETMRGKQPYWPDNRMKRHIRPVAKANGIHKKIGWHTFRHSFGTLLKANGEDVKTVQELLRQANSKITLDVHTQAVNSNKRAAQSKVVKMMVSGVGTKVAGVGTSDFRQSRLKMQVRKLIVPVLCPDFAVTIGPYVP
jgi:integrase